MGTKDDEVREVIAQLDALLDELRDNVAALSAILTSQPSSVPVREEAER